MTQLPGFARYPPLPGSTDLARDDAGIGRRISDIGLRPGSRETTEQHDGRPTHAIC
ncbi:hypothetical protein J2T21_002806 [Paeniglutamicibacter psychrophenolicus]|nr:hypothetical protein [Paeniglutamicibacter psychrophenolicus]